MISKQKLQQWVDTYINHVKEISIKTHINKEEGYKFQSVEIFQNNFDLKAEDFTGMLEKSLANNNLVIGAHYFPRNMLLIFAEEYPRETKKALTILFDSTVDVVERINNTKKIFDELMDKRNKRLKEKSNSYIALRFLSLLLSYYNPKKYNAMKPREWRAFAGYIDNKFRIPTHTPEGEKYQILSEYVEALIEYIKNNKEITKIHKGLTRGLEFDDSAYKWMAQDIIYVTACLLKEDNEKRKESVETNSLTDNSDNNLRGSTVVEDKEIQFAWEKELENFIIRNWDYINIEDGLKLYEDEDGEIGQQFPTDSGAIDILAVDKNKNFVVIELKKGRSGEKVVGQILHYMGWVKNNLATKKQNVRGIIIASDGNIRLQNAIGVINNKLELKYYRVKLDFIIPD